MAEELQTEPPPPPKRKKRPGRFRRWILRPIAWLLASALILILTAQLWLNAPQVRNRIISEGCAFAEGHFKVPVSVRDLRIELVPFSVEIWGLSFGSPPQADGEPLLEVPWARVELDLNALRRDEIRLPQIRVERPRIHLLYWADGEHNIPRFQRDGPPKPRRFDVFIESLEVEQAELLLDRESFSLSLDGDDIRARLEGVGEMQMVGRLTAPDVTVTLPEARPMRISTSARGTWERGRVTIESGRVSAGPDAVVQTQGECTWSREDRDAKQCTFHAQAESRGNLLHELGYFRDLRGPLAVDGTLNWSKRGGTTWSGRVEADDVLLWGRRVRDLRGVVTTVDSDARADIEQARYGGGMLYGAVDYVHDRRELTVDLDFDDVELNRLLSDQNIPLGAVATRVGGELLYRFDLSRSEQGSGRAEVRFTEDLALNGPPLSSDVFSLRIDEGIVWSESISLRSDRQSALAGGWYEIAGRRGEFEYEIASADLGQLSDLMPTPEGPHPAWLPTAGEGTISGTLEIEGTGIATAADLNLENVLAPEIDRPQDVQGRLRFSRSAVEDLHLEMGDSLGALLVRGYVPLEETSSKTDRRLDLHFEGVDWPTAWASPWIDFELPVQGRISGQMDLQTDEAGVTHGFLQGRVSPARLTAADVQFSDLSGILRWDDQVLHMESLEASSPAGRVLGHGTLDFVEEDLDLRLRTPGLQLGAEPLLGRLPRSDLRGRIAATARLGGNPERPELDLRVTADSLALGERLLENLPSRFDVRWENDLAEISGRLLDRIAVSGGGRLGGGETDLNLAVDGSDLAGLLELLFENPPEDVSGRFGGTVRLRTSADQALEIDLDLDPVRVQLREHELVNIEPVRLRYADRGFRIDSLYFREPMSKSDAVDVGEVFLIGDLVPELDLRFESSVDAIWLQNLLPIFQIDGELDLLGRITGSLESPVFDGQGRLKNATFSSADADTDFPYRLEQAQGVALFDPGQIVIDHLRGRIAGGRLQLSGQVDLPQDGEIQYRLRAFGEDLRMLYPEGFRLEGDTQLTLRTWEPAPGQSGWLLSGRADLENLDYLEDIPVAFSELLQTFFQRQRLEVAQTDDFFSLVDLNLVVEAPDGLRVRNNLAEFTGSADLVVRGTAAQPVFFGTIDLDPGGRLEYNETDYRLERGRLSFTDPSGVNPEIDIVANARVRDFQVKLTLSGPLDRVNARFASEPPLPNLDVFRLLASGGDETPDLRPRQVEDQRDEESSAAVFLYGQAASVIGDRVSNLFGFDKFRIDPLTGSGDNISSARVTVGKRLSKDLFVTYSADPSTTEEQRLQLEWQVSPGLTLVLTQNGDNSYSADARWETSF